MVYGFYCKARYIMHDAMTKGLVEAPTGQQHQQHHTPTNQLIGPHRLRCGFTHNAKDESVETRPRSTTPDRT